MLTSGTSSAAERWVQTGGPEGGDILVLAIDPQTPTTVYAGTAGGVFKSSNGGASWSAVNTGPTNTNVPALAIDPQTPATLYAGTAGDAIQTGGKGVFKSSNGGASWSAVNTGLTNIDVRALAIDPKTPATLYAGTFGGVFKSSNGGASWSAVNTGLGSTYVHAIAIDPKTPATLYAATSAGVLKSSNGGARWSAVNTGLTTPYYLKALAIDPQTPATLYVVTDQGVFKSSNGGESWSAVNTGLGDYIYVSALAIDPQTPATLYAATSAGVFKSSNGGASWSAVNTGLTATWVKALAIDPQTPATLYAGTDLEKGVFKSSNGGASWSVINTGLTATWVNALAIDPQTPATLYAGKWIGGVFKSSNRGASWSAVNTGLWDDIYVFALAIDPQAPTTLYAGTDRGVFKSSNGGASWSAVNTGLTVTYVIALAIDPQTPTTLYAGTGLGGGVFKSSNGGASWSAVNIGLTDTYVGALAIDPQTPTTLYAGSDLGGGVFKSSNGGSSWSVVNTGLPIKAVKALAIDPKTPATLYAGTWGGVFKSSNGGASWSAVNTGLTTPYLKALAIDPQTPTTLYAGTGLGGGVFKSSNGGASWSAVNTGLTYTYILSLAIDPQTLATLYAGTCGGGVFRLVPDNIPPEKATLISPIGTISTPTPTYTWNAVAGSSDYYLWVNDLNAQGRIRTWYTTAQAGCSSEIGTCSVTPFTLLPYGVAQWWIQTRNEAGDGPWSDGMAFTVGGGAPGKAKLVAPSGSISTATPTYTWNAVSDATWYLLWVQDSVASPKIQTWYTSAQASCLPESGICSATPSISIASGAAQWWVQTWNDAGLGPWSDGMAFTVGGGAPGKAVLISPSGSISTATPTYTWNAVSGSTWYYLWVNDAVSSPKILQWYTAAQAGCASGSGTCSVTPSAALASGSAQWWVQTYFSSGTGPWSDGMNFRVGGGITTGPYGIEFVTVAAGEFQMGSNTYSWEQPIHRVIISKSFQLGKYEITQGQWKAVMGSNPSSFKGDDNLPVETVSWDDAQAFMAKLNARNDGYRYRLPTEAEWEYACRAGTTGDYGGTGNLDEMGWYWDNSGSKTHVVGTKKANAWGLYDMHGNVWEWVQDWYGSYPSGTVTDPPGPTSGSDRVVRGGGWSDNGAYSCRSASRGSSWPGGTRDGAHGHLGFRLLRTAQ